MHGCLLLAASYSYRLIYYDITTDSVLCFIAMMAGVRIAIALFIFLASLLLACWLQVWLLRGRWRLRGYSSGGCGCIFCFRLLDLEEYYLLFAPAE
jgi:hypothetical protein